MANTCPSCGAPIDASATACPYCGAAIPQDHVDAEQAAQQIIIQQVTQEDPCAHRREQERQERKYNWRKANDTIQIALGVLLLAIAIPFISSGSDWIFWVGLIGALELGFGIKNLLKHKKEYEQNKIQ